MAFADLLVESAIAELTLWTQNDWIECVRDPKSTSKPKKPVGDPAAQAGSSRVGLYWSKGLGEEGLNGCTDRAWSAAFICWAMRQAHMPLDQFPYSAGHHAYIRWAISNSKKDKQGKTYYGRRWNQYAPKPGDLIAQWRKKDGAPDPDIGYDAQPDDFYMSHCDIVVAVTADAVRTIGGNLSNRVRETVFPAQQGILKPKKELICVLECRKA